MTSPNSFDALEAAIGPDLGKHLALERTRMAGERTLFSLIRTGFAIAGGGLLITNLLAGEDLIGQMSARNYLEKLIFLYHEFKEGHVEGYSSERMMFEKTFKFYKDTQDRLKNTLGGVDKYATVHFKKRYRISTNMYHIAIDGQIKYLAKIMKREKGSIKDKLRRTVEPETK